MTLTLIAIIAFLMALAFAWSLCIAAARADRWMERERLESLSPFERQDELLRRGGRVVERVVYAPVEHPFSLTGSSME